MPVDKKALRAAIEHCDALTADDCEGVIEAYEAALPQCAVDERDAFCEWASRNHYFLPPEDHSLTFAALHGWEAAKACPFPATESATPDYKEFYRKEMLRCRHWYGLAQALKLGCNRALTHLELLNNPENAVKELIDALAIANANQKGNPPHE